MSGAHSADGSVPDDTGAVSIPSGPPASDPRSDVARREELEASRKEELAEEVEEKVYTSLKRLIVENYSGSFPHPDHLERYAALYPRAPEIVFQSFEKQGEHRRASEAKYLRGSERRANIGQWLAYSLVAGSLLGGIALVFAGYEWAGGTIATVAFGGGLVLYVAGGARGASRTSPRGGPGNQSARAEATTGHIERPASPTPPEPGS